MTTHSSREPGTGLALSGGGFRATLFHLGSLWRLNEFGLLRRLSVVTSVSGGSITAGVLAHRWSRLAFDADGVATNFREEIAAPLRAFCTRHVDLAAGLAGMLPGVSGADVAASRYRQHLFGKATLQDLPDAGPRAPRFIFYATSLQTGASVRMGKEYLADYKVGMLPAPDIGLADAVAASSAFPPVLSPMIIKTSPEQWVDLEGTRAFGDAAFRSRLVLTDGGVYDNLGLEAIWDRYETVLVSDAGAPLTLEARPSAVWAWLTARVQNLLSEQARAIRKRHLITAFRRQVCRGTYWGISTHINDYQLPTAMTRDTAFTASLKSLRTRLNPFSPLEQGCLINWGYALTDAAMRRHVLPGGDPGQWPDPNYPL
ncbi:MAG TPA: patatin-like phospholipase family protein [Planctomycetota bacterium]|nr:patatin-like phospholipase family protein [Planctomycetota bacterium]HRR80027.1 patatin-like phospholipase family protein [Planctomycetota bacterium]HRT95880.1 patatin-like phospholipase family protein [Planctomycetota bacterium]